MTGAVRGKTLNVLASAQRLFSIEAGRDNTVISAGSDGDDEGVRRLSEVGYQRS